MKWQGKLNKTELKHFREIAGCRTLQQFQRTLNQHEKWRAADNHNPVLEPCWDCRKIAAKLGMEPTV